MAKERKWGSVDDIDNRTKVGSEAWKNQHSEDIQHLSAYRRLHQLADHEEVRHLVDAPVEDKLEEIKRLENNG